MEEQDRNQMLDTVAKGDLQVLWNLLEPLKDELAETYKKVKYGFVHRYHIQWNLKGIADDRSRSGEMLCDGVVIPLEEWWDEEEARRAEARKVLLEYYSQDEKARFFPIR